MCENNYSDVFLEPQRGFMHLMQCGEYAILFITGGGVCETQVSPIRAVDGLRDVRKHTAKYHRLAQAVNGKLC